MLRRMPLRATLVGCALLFAVYLLAGFLLVPYLVERGVPQYAAETLKRKAAVGEVRFNPLLFRLEAVDFSLAEADGAPIAAFRTLRVDFDPGDSLARRAWVFSTVVADGLDLRADIRPDGSLNLAALAADLPREAAPPAQPADGPPRLLLRHVALTRGVLAFTDRSGSAPAGVTAQPLEFELRDLSTLPGARGPYSVSAALAGGGTVRWRGELSLQPLAATGELEVAGLSAALAWRFLRDRLALAEPAGRVDFAARHRFAWAAGAPQLVLEEAQLALSGLSLAEAGAAAPMLTLERAAVTGARFDLAARQLTLPLVELARGAVAVATDAGGSLNWQRIMKAPARGGAAAAPAAPGAPWKVRIESARLDSVALDYRDASRKALLRVGVGGIGAQLAAAIEAGGAGTQVVVSDVAIQLGAVRLEGGAVAAPLADVKSARLEGGQFDLAQRRVAVGRVAVEGALVRLIRDRRGAIPLLGAFDAAGSGAPRGGAPAAGPPWRFTLDAFDLAGSRVELGDQGFRPAIAWQLVNVGGAVKHFRSDGSAPLQFSLGLRVAQGGAVRVVGEARDGGRQVTGTVRVDGLALAPLRPLVARHSALALASGRLSADAKIAYRAGAKRPQLRVAGRAAIDALRLNDAAGGERLLAWKQLAATGVRFSLAPDRLRVEEIRLVQPDAKIVIYQDRSLNLAKVLDKGEGAPSAPAAATPGAAAPFDVAVGRVRVEGGSVDFTDLSLVLPFAAEVEDLQGTASGITSDPAAAAALKLEGRVGEFGLARVDGTLKPFQPRVHTDIGVVFRNVEMTPLSPYSATFAGRKIASGRLSLDLRYKIENSQLAGDNKVVLDKFTLGERVEAPGALNLPLDLAVALLTDSNGRIDVAVPVSGNLEDPQFSYGHLIWQAIATVIRNIVTAPFRALGKLLGGGDGSPETIAFDAGRAALQPPEREKLQRVAEAIARRPQLVLVAEGQYGDADRAALRARDVALAVAARLGRAPAPDGLPEPVNPLEARTQRALEALFVERASEAALAQFAGEFAAARGRPVERASAVLALAGRASPDAAFYQALLARLNETARIPEAAPRGLADARARAVADYLVNSLSVPAARVAARAAGEPDAARVRLSFEAATAAGY